MDDLNKIKLTPEEALKFKGLEGELLEKYSCETNCKIRKKIIYILGILAFNNNNKKDEIIKLLKKALNDECPWVRGTAAEMLGKLGVEDDKIISLLEDRCPWVRHRAADALSNLCKNLNFALKSYKALLKRLNDSSPYVQNYVIQALMVCLSTFKKAGMGEKALEIEKNL